ncbi:MAG: PilZ domain-containing protein [Acidobacteriota bacterium]
MDRPVRVVFPVRVEFAGSSFQIREFTANLSVAGAFIATTAPPALGSSGRLTFRHSRWEHPFTVAAEVVRVVGADAATKECPAGIAVRFMHIKAGAAEQLRRLVAGLHEGSVAEAIRRTVRDGNRPLLDELRRCPADQKVIFAMAARGPELDAVIREGNPAAVSRLLDNPRLEKKHLRLILKDTRTPVRLLLLILRNAAWLADEETRLLLCRHPLTPLPHVLRFLGTLSTPRVRELANLAILRQAIRAAARQLLSTRR